MACNIPNIDLGYSFCWYAIIIIQQLTAYQNLFYIIDKLLPCKIKHGFVRSKGKFYNYQTILTIDAPQYVRKGVHISAKRGWHPQGEGT